MITKSLLAVTLALLALPAEAADPGRCAAIRDPDRRQACMAETQRQPSRCGTVRDPDSRHICQAQASSNRSRCASIRNADRRQACQAGMGW